MSLTDKLKYTIASAGGLAVAVDWAEKVIGNIPFSDNAEYALTAFILGTSSAAAHKVKHSIEAAHATLAIYAVLAETRFDLLPNNAKDPTDIPGVLCALTLSYTVSKLYQNYKLTGSLRRHQ